MPASDAEDLNLVPAPADQDVFGTDAVLVDSVHRYGADQHAGRLRDLGRVVGTPRCARWAEYVDRYPPTLRTHDPFGRRVDEVEFHPAWHRLMQTGVRAGLTAAPWHQPKAVAGHTARAAALMLWSQTEIGHITALSTTYAAAPALRSDEKLEALWLPRLGSRAYESGLRPAAQKVGSLCGVAVAERHTGTDLAELRTVARPEPGGPVDPGDAYRLDGAKWYVCAPMSDVFLVLAQAPGGLTCFLVPRVLADGTRNTWRLSRLKPTLGSRAGAAAEVELDGTWGVRLGEEGTGQRCLAGTVAATRLDAVLTGAGTMRHALRRAVHHARHRRAGGSALVDQPLMQNVLADLAVESEAATLLGMRLAAAVDAGETDLLRVGVPVAKYWIGKRTPPVVAEALECLGGNGYVEEHGLARIYRDCLVNTLWEGTGNIAALDVLRGMSAQPGAMEVLLGEIDLARGADPRLDQAMDDVAEFLQAAGREARRDPAAVEAGARWMVERLAVVLQASLVVQHSSAAVISAFLATRVAGGGGAVLGTLPVGRRATESIVEHACPA